MFCCFWKPVIMWLHILFYTILALLVLLIVVLPLGILFLKFYVNKKRKYYYLLNNTNTVAFFHPYCNAGGGGERVLWTAVLALLQKCPNYKIYIYTGDVDASPSEITKRAHQRFNICIPEHAITFIYLYRRKFVEASLYPYFTLLGQSIGSMILGFEALLSFQPDIFIDTMGYAFTYPLFSYIGGCKVACYIHYPTITKEMLTRVARRVITHNNSQRVANNPILTSFKLFYYKVFALLYSHVGKYSDIIMVNSSWTEEHIVQLWNCQLKTYKLYPPCDTEDLKKITHTKTDGPVKIISVAQFRPEKDHPLQLRAMYQLRQIISEAMWDNLKFIFIGSTRNEQDETCVKDMQDLCKHLSLENNVEFKVNLPYDDMKKEFGEGLIGLHAMWNEHFGIGVVECMAAGLIMIAHKSGGPKMDIVIEEPETCRNGFLACDEVEYAQMIQLILHLSPETKARISRAAVSSVDRFSNEEFKNGFLTFTQPLFKVLKKSS
uniref:GDP-Man:Man(3)GlcNAc(2)-PP-Dol alpha-1,2-mannosyltransferase n=1 Tax=Cacopsylla melanoneura TaxID=428564 RepID=A0A8D8QZQ8_9HEMI